LNILHIFDDYGTPCERALPGIGSVPSVVYNLAKYSVKKGHNVTILERGHSKNTLEEEYIDDIHYVKIKARELPAAPYRLIKSPNGVLTLLKDSWTIARKINDFLNKNKDFDIIHFHFPFAASFLVNLNRNIRSKCVYTAHVGEEAKRFGFNSVLRFMLSPDVYLMKRIKKSVVLNENLKNKLIAKGVRNIAVIPNGIDVEQFYIDSQRINDIRRKYNLDDNIVIMFAGTITPRKGVQYLVKAAKKIVDSGYRNVKFLFVGNTELDVEFFSSILSYIKQNNLTDYILFTGYVPYEDLKSLYCACDIFVLPSLGEGDPIALKEALAAGKPIVATNVGGIPMQVIDGWNGFLISVGDVKVLSAKLIKLISNPVLKMNMGCNSKFLAASLFNWGRIVDFYINKVYI